MLGIEKHQEVSYFNLYYKIYDTGNTILTKASVVNNYPFLSNSFSWVVEENEIIFGWSAVVF